MCIVAALIALMGCFLERLPREMFSLYYFRKKGDAPPELMRRTKVWMIASGVSAFAVAAIGVWTQLYLLQMLVPLVILLVCVVAIYAMWLQGASRMMQGIVWTALVVTLGLVVIMFARGAAETQAQMGPTALEIRGFYSLDVPYDGIERVVLSDEAPRTMVRTNGFSANDIRKGYFRMENDEKCFLSTDAAVPEYIYIFRRDDFPVVLNLYTLMETRELFRELKTRIDQHEEPATNEKPAP